MPEPEVHHDDGMARLLYDAITETRAPGASVDWAHLSENEQTFYREAALRLQAAGGMSVKALPDDAADEEEDEDGIPTAIDLSRALQVQAVSVGIMRADNGSPSVVGHFGGYPKGEDRRVGSAWMLHPDAAQGLIRQIIEAMAAVDTDQAGQFVVTAVGAMDRVLQANRSRLTVPAIRPTDLRRN